MTNTAPAVTVVIPTKHRSVVLEKSLRAVLAAGRRLGGSFEVLVLDDGNDQTTEAVTTAAAATTENGIVHYVPGLAYGGRGQGDARNEGARRAQADLLAFTDDDTECADDWLQRAVRRLDAEPWLAGLEGAVIPRSMSRLDPVRVRVVENTRGRAFLTANLVLRRSAFFRAGGVRRLRTDRHARWDHSFREDTDLALRVEEHVGSVPFDRDLQVFHPFEHPQLTRYLHTAMFFEVDEAFRMVHPGAIPRVMDAPFARWRVRIGCLVAIGLPLAAIARARAGAACLLASASVVMNAQIERDLRRAGLRRGLVQTCAESIKRSPRCVSWCLVAGVARIAGMVEARGGLVPVRRDGDLPATNTPSRDARPA